MEFRPFRYYRDELLGSAETVNQDKKLSIRYSPNGFSFSIILPAEKKMLAYGTYSLRVSGTGFKLMRDLKDIFTSNENLRGLHFREVEVVHLSPVFTVLPASMTDRDQARNYLKFACQANELGQIGIDTAARVDAAVVYEKYPELEDFFAEKAGSIHSRHSLAAFMDSAEPEDCSWDFRLDVEQDIFQLVVFKNRKLEFANLFHYATPEDFIYYLLLAASQLRAEPSDIRLTLYGDIKEDDDVFRWIDRHIGNILFGQRDKSLWYSKALDEIPAHAFRL